MNPTDTPTPQSNQSDMAMPAPEPAAPDAPQSAAPKTKKKFGLPVIVAVVAVVLLGGSAGAYFGVVVPNKPENLLKKSVDNLTQQDSFTAKGKIDVAAEGSNAVVDVNMAHVDSAKKVMLLDMNITVSGIKLPIEVRYVDSTAYVKLGDLSTIKNLVAGYGGSELAPVINEAEKKLSNQWVEIDKTLLSQAASSSGESKCTPEEVTIKTRAALNDTAKLAVDGKNSFYTIKNSSKETVDGAKTTKLELEFDKTKAKDFANKTKELESAKELAKCVDQPSQSTEEALDDEANLTAFNVWIDGSKTIRRFEIKVDSGKDSSKATTTIDMTTVKDAPTVEKPANAKPVMQLYGELMNLYGGGSSQGGGLEDLSSSLSL